MPVDIREILVPFLMRKTGGSDRRSLLFMFHTKIILEELALTDRAKKQVFPFEQNSLVA